MGENSKDFLKDLSPSSMMPCNPERSMLAGAWGGAMVGYTSGYFHPSRIVPPKSPLPPTLPPKAHEGMRIAVMGSALGWRIVKRMLTGSILYPLIICNLHGNKDAQNPPGILMCSVAGGMTGAIFGLRGGGPVAVLNGAVTFAAFAAFTEAFHQYKDRRK